MYPGPFAMSGNYVSGAIRNEGLAVETWAECRCDGSFSKGASYCHHHPIVNVGLFDSLAGGGVPMAAHGFCPHWATNR